LLLYFSGKGAGSFQSQQLFCRFFILGTANSGARVSLDFPLTRNYALRRMWSAAACRRFPSISNPEHTLPRSSQREVSAQLSCLESTLVKTLEK
jgi:hypothetical protein